MKRLTGVILFIILLLIAPSALAKESLYTASVSGEVSMHISPDEESYVIIDVPACSKLNLIAKERTWGLVEFDNKCGWINISYTRSSYSQAALASGKDAEQKVKVVSEKNPVPLYSVPSDEESLGSKIKYTVINDQILEIVRETPSGWGLVRVNQKKYAWIKMVNTAEFGDEFDATQYGAIEYVYVLSKDGKGVDLWESPNRDNSLLIIPDCIRLTVREKKGGYAFVAHNGVNGWIDYSCTTESLSNAQNSTGTALNAEYIVTPRSTEGARVLNIPSDRPEDGAVEVSVIGRDESVFVQRTTVTGWCLVNHNGELGWISSDDLTRSEGEKTEITEVLSSPAEGYVSTKNGTGMKLYATLSSEFETATVPECVKVTVIAEKDGYEYVINDYAAGWAEKGQLKKTYADAINRGKPESGQGYVAEKDLGVMSLPTYNEQCQSVELAQITKKTTFNVTKIVKTGKHSWGLTEFGGIVGWADLSNAERTQITAKDILLVTGVIFSIIILALLAIFLHRKIAFVRKSPKDETQKELEENEKNVSDENSESHSSASDVSGK